MRKQPPPPPLVFDYQHVGICHCLVADELPARRLLFQVVKNCTPRHNNHSAGKLRVSRYFLRDDISYWLFQQGIRPRNFFQLIYDTKEDDAPVGKRLPSRIMLVFPSKRIAMLFKLTFG